MITTMAYTVTNYPTKKAVRDALANGETIRVYQPGPFGPDVADGQATLEGPHYPKPHKWYAEALVADGVLVRIR